MRRYIVILIVIMRCVFWIAHVDGTEMYVQGEYRNDAIDYENAEYDFYRIKTGARFGGASSINTAWMYLERTGSRTHTWNCVLGDISPHLSLIIGNFHASFGSGLIVGKRNPFNPDIFTAASPEYLSSTFRPSCTGNPAGSFSGIALSAGYGLWNTKLSLDVFYSDATRFISENDYNRRETGSSPTTIGGSVDRTYTHSEPVVIRTTGAMLTVFALDHIAVQLSSVYLRMHTPGGNNTLAWDAENIGCHRVGTSAAAGSAILVRYSDNVLSMFCEYALTARTVERDESKQRAIYGDGVLCGISLDSPFFTLSATGRNTNVKYYAPCSAAPGASGPAQGCFFDITYRPAAACTLGSLLSIEKKLLAAHGADELPVTRREQAYAAYRGKRIRALRCFVKHYEKTEGTKLSRLQISHDAELVLTDRVRMSWSLLYQRANPAPYSAMAGTGVCLLPTRRWRFDCEYRHALIGYGNNIYAVISPMEQSSIPGTNIQKTTDIVIANASMRYESVQASLRYMRQYAGGCTMRRRIEMMASGTF